MADPTPAQREARSSDLDLLLHRRSAAGRWPALPEVGARPGAWRRMAGVTVGVLLAGVVGWLVVDQVHQHDQFDRSHSSLVVEQRRIADTSAQLTEVQHELDVVSSQEVEDGAVAAQDSAELRGAEGALAGAQARVSAQQSLIGSLQTCLAGVEEALNALAVRNDHGAAGALASVASSCSAAADE